MPGPHSAPSAAAMRLFLFRPGEAPTADEVRSARFTAAMTQAEAASLVYYTRASTWAAIEGARAMMDPARWHLFLLLTGLQAVPARGAS